MANTTMIQSYVAGEVPFDLSYQFLDHDGVGIDLSGWTAEQVTTDPAGVQTTDVVTVDAGTDGIVTRPWTAAFTAQRGVWTAHIWVESAPYKLASTQIVWVVR